MRLIILLFASAVIAGCGYATIDRTYDDKLIRDVGTGSLALGSVVPALEAERNSVPASFTDPRNDRTTRRLFEGQLDKLSVQDLVRLVKANRGLAARFDRIPRKLNRLADDIRAARINAGAYTDLSNGARRFLKDWNTYLAASAKQVRMVRRSFIAMRPLFVEFEELIRAAYDTARLRSTSQFDQVKKRVIADTVRRSRGIRREVAAFGTRTPADRRFTDLVNSNQEAQAIVRKVNERYPQGALAEQFSR